MTTDPRQLEIDISTPSDISRAAHIARMCLRYQSETLKLRQEVNQLRLQNLGMHTRILQLLDTIDAICFEGQGPSTDAQRIKSRGAAQ